MSRFSQAVISGLLVGMLSACATAHYRDVRPTAIGPHTVVIPVADKGQGFRPAMEQARTYCSEVHKKSAVVVTEETKYIGSMDEKSYQAAKTVANITAAAGMVGGAMAPNKKNFDNAMIAGMGGGIASGAIGDGYQYTLVFNCQ